VNFPRRRIYGGGSSTGLGELTNDQQIFRKDGEPWVWLGFSFFKAAELARLEEWGLIDDILGDYEGLEVPRVWDYVDWDKTGWNSPGIDVWLRLIDHFEKRGRFTSITALTSDNQERINPAIQLINEITAAGFKYVIWEGGNEPNTNKSINTHALIPAMQASGRPWCTGDYENSAYWKGTHGRYHPARTYDFSRRAHDAEEYYSGGGPNSQSEPACKVPWVNDEPGKIQDVGKDWRAWLAHYVASRLMGAGITVHTETGKLGQRPTSDEHTLIDIARYSRSVWPADAANGGYRRVTEPGQPDYARTYVIGEKYMVRCQQPETPFIAEDGWISIENSLVLYQKG
jgi:hypothetical protein